MLTVRALAVKLLVFNRISNLLWLSLCGYFLQGDYKAEKKPVFKHAFPPQYSFGLRTPYGKQDNNPAPNNYNMPSIIGPKAVGKKSSAAFSMTSRSKIGSFHEDLQKVGVCRLYEVEFYWFKMLIVLMLCMLGQFASSVLAFNSFGTSLPTHARKTWWNWNAEEEEIKCYLMVTIITSARKIIMGPTPPPPILRPWFLDEAPKQIMYHNFLWNISILVRQKHKII